MLESTTLKWIAYYCISSFILEFTGDILGFLKINNVAVFYLFIWNSTFCLIGFFIKQSIQIRKILTYKFAIFLLILMYYGDELNEPKADKILNKPEFWIVSGLFIYYGATWIILLAAHYFVKSPITFMYIWEGQNVLNILKNIAIAIGLYKYRWN
jgi:hypothetical protein